MPPLTVPYQGYRAHGVAIAVDVSAPAFCASLPIVTEQADVNASVAYRSSASGYVNGAARVGVRTHKRHAGRGRFGHGPSAGESCISENDSVL